MTAAPLLVLGAGQIGRAVAAARPGSLVVRRSGCGPGPWCDEPGDAADPALHQRLRRRWGTPSAILMAASPGLRRGADNGLERIASACAQAWPQTPVVVIASSGVYADAGGRRVDEQGLLQRSGRGARLREIERCFQQHPAGCVVLRATAITSAERARSSQRAASGEVTVAGSPDRAFTWVHESDLAWICTQALDGVLGRTGLWNVAAPGHITLRSYWRRVAALRGQTIIVHSAGEAPERIVDAGRIHRALPQWKWREALE